MLHGFVNKISISSVERLPASFGAVPTLIAAVVAGVRAQSRSSGSKRPPRALISSTIGKGGITDYKEVGGKYAEFKYKKTATLRRRSFLSGAEGETRTPTSLRTLEPESSVSTNSTTSA